MQFFPKLFFEWWSSYYITKTGLMSVEKRPLTFLGGKKPFDLLELLPKKKWQLLGATPCNWASPLSHAPPFCWSRLGIETKNLCSKSKRRTSGSLMQFGLSPVNLTHPLLPIERVLSKLACAAAATRIYLMETQPTSAKIVAFVAICNESSSV